MIEPHLTPQRRVVAADRRERADGLVRLCLEHPQRVQPRIDRQSPLAGPDERRPDARRPLLLPVAAAEVAQEGLEAAVAPDALEHRRDDRRPRSAARRVGLERRFDQRVDDHVGDAVFEPTGRLRKRIVESVLGEVPGRAVRVRADHQELVVFDARHLCRGARALVQTIDDALLHVERRSPQVDDRDEHTGLPRAEVHDARVQLVLLLGRTRVTALPREGSVTREAEPVLEDQLTLGDSAFERHVSLLWRGPHRASRCASRGADGAATRASRTQRARA